MLRWTSWTNSLSLCNIKILMDPNNIPFNTLKGPTNSGNQLQGPFYGKFDYMELICPTFVHNKTYDGFVDHDLRIFVIECQKEEVELRLKLSCHFFSGDEQAHCFGRLHCLKGCERLHWPVGLSWLFSPQCRYQHLGSDTADHQHRKNIPRKRSHHRFFILRRERHLWGLCWQALSGGVQGTDGRAENEKNLLI